MYVMIALVIIGIALLLGGIFFMRFGLQKLLWIKLQTFLSLLTSTPMRGLLVGIVAAAFMQSSTAVSLLTIGLVHAQYLSFYQGLGIILGANIGTCSTVQLMTITMPEKFIIPLFLFFLLFTILCRKFRYFGMAISGLLSMFIGMSILSEALSNISEFTTIIDYLLASQENSIYAIVGGIIITLLFQSSSAATGVLMVLASDGIIDLTTATYVVYGNNIGSCLSSFIVGVTASLAAKRLAVAHILLNVLGVIIFFPITGILTKIATSLTADFAGQVAIVHTLFNIISSLAVLPIIHQYANLVMLLIPKKR
ncbi:Na/Pi cotransporter family protein [Pelosinus propionicus]|uniref:Phosphate:Na+ symporter n=1 Tax=Pelosinus propionicus DSM 13327 TaxID=1123291 RepID=A0A1I4GSB2_9FIRM|nr:Na/Pi symporter [Pelosinus propionicus]SFL32962.1 phosphate:Na+ symporter [Pelosinus propionicus DSM 13327]